MKRILEYLKDPSWWFSVLFVGMIASLFAAYLKDLIPFVFSRYSVRMRRWRHKRLVQMGEEVMKLKSDSRLFFFHGIRVLFEYIAVVLSCLILFLIGPLHRFYTDYPRYDPLRLFDGYTTELFIGVLTIFAMPFMICAMFRFYRIGSIFLRVDLEIRRRYNWRCKSRRNLHKSLG